MRCSRKSTTWLASALVALLLSAETLPSAAQPGCDRADVAPAVEQAIAAALGVDAGVRAAVLACDVDSPTNIERAQPEPGARFGRPARFKLFVNGRVRGYATAVATGAVAHVRTLRMLAAGTIIGTSDVAVVTRELDGALLQPLPQLADVIGASALRALERDEVLTARAARVRPAVRSGDRVVVRARVGRVEVVGAGTAQQSGGVGDVIRLVNVDSRRALRARVIGKGEVEVVHGS